MPPPVTSRPGVVTRAKNATQRPGLVDLESQHIWRGPVEMAEVRSKERLDTRLTDQRLYATLKKVAEIQDQQQHNDFKASIQKVAPSLRCEKKVDQVPDDNDAFDKAIPAEKAVETQQVDPMDEGLGIDEDAPPMQRQRLAEPEFDDYSNFKSGDEGVPRKRKVAYYDYFNFGTDDEDLAPIAAREPPKKKKKKGDGLRDIVATLQKNPPGENSKVKMNLVTQVPPIPALKGKVKAHPLCVEFYIYPNIIADRYFFFTFGITSRHHLTTMTLYLCETTLFYHHLRSSATRSPSVAHPTTKPTVGLVGNWIDEVANAGRSTPSLSYGSSQSRVGLNRNWLASGSRGSPSTESQLGALEHDIEDEILSCLAPEPKASIAQPPVNYYFSLGPCSY